MHRAFWFMAIFAALVVAPLARAADQPAAQAHIKGLWLTTDYPSVAARVGETTTIKMKLQNYDLPPERVALSVDGAPKGWNVVILGGSTPVTAAMPATNDNVALSLRVEIPTDAPAGTQHLVVHAKAGDASSDLPIDITTGQDLPAQLTIKPKLPSLNGTADDELRVPVHRHQPERQGSAGQARGGRRRRASRPRSWRPMARRS